VTERIAEEALRHLLAVKQDKPLPRIRETTPVKPELTRKLDGRYKSGNKTIDLVERDGRLWLFPDAGGCRVELRADADGLIVDDRLDHGRRVTPEGDKLRIDGETYERIAFNKPEPPPAKWLGLIGEYGWDHDTLYILEKDGRLHALIEWFFLYPLEEVSGNVYKFPGFGLYHDEKLIFTRDPTGRATQVEAAKVVFARRKLDGENGATFKIKPARPLDPLRREALAARPPEEKGDFLPTELVDLTTLDGTIKLDIRYATDNNFLSTPFYTSAKAFMQEPAAEALARVHKKLATQGYGLLVFDGYRPWSVTKMFWEATPEKLRVFVADPEKGSRHNRGCAVDLTLYDLKTGKPVEMVGGYDEMSDRSYPDYLGGTSSQRWHRELLRRAMEAEGFTVYEAEWWHFDYKDWKRYRIGNQSFEEIPAGKAGK
jgi:serine beta-lactamase-like protein LACTB